MKAITYREYGGPEVLRLEEGAKPAPKDDEVLVPVRAAALNPYDMHFLRGTPYFTRRSKWREGFRPSRYRHVGLTLAKSCRRLAWSWSTPRQSSRGRRSPVNPSHIPSRPLRPEIRRGQGRGRWLPEAHQRNLGPFPPQETAFYAESAETLEPRNDLAPKRSDPVM
jgi:hypothetical protein